MITQNDIDPDCVWVSVSELPAQLEPNTLYLLKDNNYRIPQGFMFNPSENKIICLDAFEYIFLNC